jgi:hypothetical protein
VRDSDHLWELAAAGDLKNKGMYDPELYPKHLEQIRALRNNHNESTLSLIVGVDIVGDETVNPYNPFRLSEFQEFLVERRKAKPNFGVRLHLGELIDPATPAGYQAIRLGETYVDVLSQKGLNGRCGHGIGMPLLTSAVLGRWKAR